MLEEDIERIDEENETNTNNVELQEEYGYEADIGEVEDI